MSKRQWLQFIISITGLFLSPLAAGHAAEKCVTKPNGPATHGQHWYYHRINNRLCWYLDEAGLPVTQHAPDQKQGPAAKADAQAAPATRPQRPQQARVQPAPQERAQQMRGQLSAAGNSSTAPSDGNVSANAAQPVRPDVAASSGTPDFLWPDPPPPPAQTASAGDLPSVSSAGANETSDPPRPADYHLATGAIERQPPTHEQAPAQPAASLIATTSEPTEDYSVFTLFLILIAGLAGGTALYVLARWRRLRSVDDLRPPVWARVVSLNAPIPRIRLRQSLASSHAPEEQAPPLVPADHTEQLARALQDLADRLRGQHAAVNKVPNRSARQRPL